MAKNRTISELLQATVADFPRQKSQLLEQLNEVGLEPDSDDISYIAEPPLKAEVLPAVDLTTEFPLSDMLRERFELFGEIVRGPIVWPAPRLVRRVVGEKRFREYHKSLKVHWDGSAPNRYPDRCLSVFAFAKNVPDTVTYLVLAGSELAEPELWAYSGTSQRIFGNLCEYLEWSLETS